MTESQPRPDESVNRVASLLAQALTELQQASSAERVINEARQELVASRTALESLATQFERRFADETEQRLILAGQLTTLATSLDRLVNHLQGLSELMAGILERMAAPAPATEAPAAEPSFLPGGEGISVAIAAVPNFQVLMDIQKALVGLDPVAGASVERFQEGDARVLVHLEAPVSALDFVASLRAATNYAFVVEESRPELMSLRLKIVSGS